MKIKTYKHIYEIETIIRSSKTTLIAQAKIDSILSSKTKVYILI